MLKTKLGECKLPGPKYFQRELLLDDDSDDDGEDGEGDDRIIQTTTQSVQKHSSSTVANAKVKIRPGEVTPNTHKFNYLLLWLLSP